MSNLGTKLDGSTFPSGDDVGAVVIDLGSLYIQAGNAGTVVLEREHHR